jgi:hypothetical protein
VRSESLIGSQRRLLKPRRKKNCGRKPKRILAQLSSIGIVRDDEIG